MSDRPPRKPPRRPPPRPPKRPPPRPDRSSVPETLGEAPRVAAAAPPPKKKPRKRPARKRRKTRRRADAFELSSLNRIAMAVLMVLPMFGAAALVISIGGLPGPVFDVVAARFITNLILVVGVPYAAGWLVWRVSGSSGAANALATALIFFAFLAQMATSARRSGALPVSPPAAGARP